MAKCHISLTSITSQFRSFLHWIVFDLFFYCVTVKTIYLLWIWFFDSHLKTALWKSVFIHIEIELIIIKKISHLNSLWKRQDQGNSEMIYCYLFTAKGGFFTKFWPNKVLNYNFFSLHLNLVKNPPLTVNLTIAISIYPGLD